MTYNLQFKETGEWKGVVPCQSVNENVKIGRLFLNFSCIACFTLIQILNCL